MGKAERNRRTITRERIAAQQAAAQRAEQRRKALVAGGTVLAVLALVIVIIVVKATQAPAKTAAPVQNATWAQEITTVPAATFNQVGVGASAGLKSVTGAAPLTSGGKPEVLYMGGEYCPYCAAERWAMAAAVSRFGTLSGLHFIHSSPADGNVPTITFYKSSYTSKYLSFVPVEWYGETEDSSTPFGHVYLQHPSTQQVALFNKYAGRAIPFLDIGNQYVLPGVSYLFTDIQNLTWSQIAAGMQNPSSKVAKDIDGAANVISAAICKITHGQPGNVCTSAGVTAAEGSV